MLTFSSEIHVKEDCVRQSVLSLLNQWFLSSGLSKQWLSKKQCSPFDQYQNESEFTDGTDNITIEIMNEADFLLVQIKTTEKDYSRNTFCVFRDQESQPVFYVGELLDVIKFGTAFTAKASGIYARGLVQYLFWNEYQQDYDGTIMNSDRTIFLTGTNLKDYTDVLSGTGELHANPFLYIPYAATEVIQKFEKPFVGQLHILAESTPLISKKVQDMLPAGKPFPKDNIVLKWYDGTTWQITDEKDMKHVLTKTDTMIDKIQLNLQDVLLTCPPDERFVISKLKESKMLQKFANDPEVSAVFDSILADKESEITTLSRNVADLKKELHDEKLKSAALSDSYHKPESDEKSGMFVMCEVPKYEHEAEDIILRVLEKERDGMVGDKTLESSRKYHVLCDILAHNFPSETGTELRALIKDVFAEGKLTRDGIGRLSSAGFTVEKNDRQSHYRIVWKGDDRYVATYAATSSDGRAGKNAASVYTNLCLGY